VRSAKLQAQYKKIDGKSHLIPPIAAFVRLPRVRVQPAPCDMQGRG
jgi:hypothetical protein